MKKAKPILVAASDTRVARDFPFNVPKSCRGNCRGQEVQGVCQGDGLVLVASPSEFGSLLSGEAAPKLFSTGSCGFMASTKADCVHLCSSFSGDKTKKRPKEQSAPSQSPESVEPIRAASA